MADVADVPDVADTWADEEKNIFSSPTGPRPTDVTDVAAESEGGYGCYGVTMLRPRPLTLLAHLLATFSASTPSRQEEEKKDVPLHVSRHRPVGLLQFP